MAVSTVVASPLVVPEPPLELLLVEAVWSPVPVEPPAPVVSLPVLVTAAVLAFVLLTVVPTAVPPLVSVTLPVTEPVVPEPAVLALELVGLLAESCCAVEEDPEPQAATKPANRTTVIESDTLFIAAAFSNGCATGRHRGTGARSAGRVYITRQGCSRDGSAGRA